MISTTTLFLFSILFFRFEDTAELTHNCILYKVCFYDIYLSNISMFNIEYWYISITTTNNNQLDILFEKEYNLN